jgi:hypothetical protein
MVMATNAPYNNVAYGLSQPLLNVFPVPIVSTRTPTTRDRADIGTIWVNKSTNTYYVLTSVVANVSTWTTAGTGAGIFTSLEATSGNITADAGNIVATLGGITALAGNITATSGNLVIGGTAAITGNLTVSSGDIVATVGNVVVTLGNLTVSAGDLTVSAGEIEAAAGAVRGAQVEASGDLGPVVSITSITNVTNTTQAAGTLAVKSTTANAGNNAGFIKVYVGATTAYVPYFTNIAP